MKTQKADSANGFKKPESENQKAFEHLGGRPATGGKCFLVCATK